jgi:hypothetical protein
MKANSLSMQQMDPVAAKPEAQARRVEGVNG